MVSKAIASLDAWLASAPKRSWPSSEKTPSPRPWGFRGATERGGVDRHPRHAVGRPGGAAGGPLRPSWALDLHRRVRRASTPLLAGAGLRGRIAHDRDRVEPLPRRRAPMDASPRGATPGLDWEWQIRPYRTNWSNVQATTSPDVASVARQGLATLRELFELNDDDPVLVKMFSSSNRGDTPAGSPVPVRPEPRKDRIFLRVERGFNGRGAEAVVRPSSTG